jgi:hypothetical protein
LIDPDVWFRKYQFLFLLLSYAECAREVVYVEGYEISKASEPEVTCAQIGNNGCVFIVLNLILFL